MNSSNTTNPKVAVRTVHDLAVLVKEHARIRIGYKLTELNTNDMQEAIEESYRQLLPTLDLTEVGLDAVTFEILKEQGILNDSDRPV